MDAVDYRLLVWKPFSTYSIQEAVLLIIGIPPEGKYANFLHRTAQEYWPESALPFFKMIERGIKEEQIKGKVSPIIDEYENEIFGTVCMDASTVNKASLRDFLRREGISDCFFNTESDENVSYLDKRNPCYAPKLAACVHAWLAITTNSEYQDVSTPKKNAETWLKKNAHKYGLQKENGDFNVSAIEEMAKIINYRPEGGASKTPVSNKSIDIQNQETETFKVKKATIPDTPPTPKKVVAESAFDDEIPF